MYWPAGPLSGSIYSIAGLVLASLLIVKVKLLELMILLDGKLQNQNTPILTALGKSWWIWLKTFLPMADPSVLETDTEAELCWLNLLHLDSFHPLPN